MANIKHSLFDLEGNIGDVTFIRTKNGLKARKKTGVSAERIKNDPKFAPVRENMSVFAKGVQATKLFRKAFKSHVEAAADARIGNRLNQLFIRILNKDEAMEKVDRRILKEHLRDLEFFEFNKGNSFAMNVRIMPATELDTENNLIRINRPSVDPNFDLSIPMYATHVRFIYGAAMLDFEQGSVEFARSTGPFLDLSDPSFAAAQVDLALELSLPGIPAAVVGVQYFRKDGPSMKPILDRTANAAQLTYLGWEV